MKTKLRILIIISVLLTIYIGVSFYVANAMTSPMVRHIEISPELISKNHQDIQFEAGDGTKLKGWLFNSPSNKLIIFVSGILGNRVDTPYYTVLIAQELVAKNYNVLLYDSRAHGESEGKRIGYGSTEGGDILGAIKFAENQGFPSEKIGIIANSVGAISTLMVIDQLEKVGAVVLDTPASEFAPIISDRLWKEKFVPPFFHPTIFLFNKIFFGVDLKKIRPIDKIVLVGNHRFLFLHAAKDATIPIINSQKLLEKANPNSKLVVFPNGEHIETYKSDPDLYQKEVFGFLEGELK